MSDNGVDRVSGPRVLRRDEWDDWYESLVRAFGGVPEPGEERELFRELTEVDRSLGVWDGGWVGTAGAFTFGLTVPGARRCRRRASPWSAWPPRTAGAGC
ncbi:hypothetical protein SHKM778_79290 [Streptomyces sp. KM77-8]|uniref:Uncharacterized protein n=1 Tax=Streptomyces haneummycinicus TaxID=3074435 RepID=A0AAT9HV49_9ACTN